MKPVILIVDDESKPLGKLEAALERRFGADYDVVAYESAHAALARLRSIKAEGGEVALVVADEQMPEMPGVELLSCAHQIDDSARRALLVWWGDRSASTAILEGCAWGKLDNYLVKPWEPPEVHLYPLVSEFLSEWTREQRPPLEIVHLVGEEPSRRTHELREFLERNGIPYGFHAASSPSGRALLEETGATKARLPIVVLLDGRPLSDPTNTEVGDALI
ncbi:MAG: response regulator [Deltaproteobacteria bacterium]|nr:response regulator [Deltaproteobacteria bacterium]